MEPKTIEASELLTPMESRRMASDGEVVHVFKVNRSDKINSIIDEKTFAYGDRIYTVKSVNIQPASSGDLVTLNCQF